MARLVAFSVGSLLLALVAIAGLAAYSAVQPLDVDRRAAVSLPAGSPRDVRLAPANLRPLRLNRCTTHDQLVG